MSDGLSIEEIKEELKKLSKNVVKIRKFIRDHQSQLQLQTTNQLNRELRDVLPENMVLKRNYGVLSLRAAPKKEETAIEQEEVQSKPTKIKKPIAPPVSDDEQDDQEDDQEQERTTRRPKDEQYIPEDERPPRPRCNYISNEDIARQCFLPAALRKYRN